MSERPQLIRTSVHITREQRDWLDRWARTVDPADPNRSTLIRQAIDDFRAKVEPMEVAAA